MDEETGTMVREGVESIVNPLDLYAIETGIQLKERDGGEIIALSMGPRKAEKSLREAIAMGCDGGVLISGKEFAGSDTWVTAYTLSEAIRKIGGFDLVITGERATDGDTGQVGPGIASFLDVPLAAYTSGVIELRGSTITVERLIEEGYEMLRLTLPAVLTVVKEIAYPRLPTLRGKQRARAAEIPVWSVNDLAIGGEEVGLKGSPTRVEKIFTPRVARGGTIIRADREGGVEEVVEGILDFMRERSFVE
jgi:electron transfer flavoprotein beta subunit